MIRRERGRSGLTVHRRRAAARRSGGRATRRAKVLATIIAVVGLAGLAGIGYKLLHRAAAAAATPTVAPTPPAGAALAPAATVREYFAAINNQHLPGGMAAHREARARSRVRGRIRGHGARHVTIVSRHRQRRQRARCTPSRPTAP